MSDAPEDRGARRAARAIDALRRGWPLRVSGPDGALDLLAVESARDAALAEFAGHDMLLSGERAVTLKLTNQRVAATPGPVRLAGAGGTVAAALAIADPALDLANPLKGPFHTIATGGDAAAAAAMTMARHAGLLPAFFVREAAGDAETECSAGDVAALLDVVSHTPIEVETLARLQAASNWVDLGRHFIEAPTPLYPWWSYRAKDWQASNRGRRLDHMWATPDLMTAAVSHRIVQPARSWERPSDHIPLITEFDF